MIVEIAVAPSSAAGLDLATGNAAQLAALPWPTDADVMEPSAARNTQAAGFAAQALAEHARLSGWGDLSAESAAIDLVTGLMHLADAAGMSFVYIQDMARRNYDDETQG